MAKSDAVTFTVQPVEVNAKASGYVVSGFLNKNQLVELRKLLDTQDVRGWRGQYRAMAMAILGAIESAVPPSRSS